MFLKTFYKSNLSRPLLVNSKQFLLRLSVKKLKPTPLIVAHANLKGYN